MSAAVLVGILVAGGIYLVLARGLVRMAVGFVLLGHAANVLLLAAGGMDRREPALVGAADPDAQADPLPQAFALTAIVITFGITVLLLALARVRAEHSGDDDTDGTKGTDGTAPDEAGERR